MRNYSSPMSPDMFESGKTGRMTGTSDEYFDTFEGDSVVRIVLDDFVNLLPEWQRSAVQMTIMSKMTFQEAAEYITKMRGISTHKKTVWRWAQKGVAQIKEWLVAAPWVATITRDKIPVQQIDVSIPVNLPWEENDGS